MPTRGYSSPPSPTAKAWGRHLSKAGLPRARPGGGARVARPTAPAACGHFPDGSSFAPARVRVTVRDATRVRTGDARRTARIEAAAEAELAPPGELGRLRWRLRRPACDPPGRAHAAGRRSRVRPDGARGPRGRHRPDHHERVPLDAEQAVLFARHPDPRWVAPPGRSLHRLGTELDLGPPARTMARRATPGASTSFSDTRGSPGTSATPKRALLPGLGGADGAGGERVRLRPGRYAPVLARPRSAGTSRPPCSRRRSTPSPTSTRSRSARGRAGIAQFMPGTAAALGLTQPVRRRAGDRRPGPPDARPAAPLRGRPAGARRLQRGPGAVAACGCVPPTGDPGYVARILGLMGGAGAGREHGAERPAGREYRRAREARCLPSSERS